MTRIALGGARASTLAVVLALAAGSARAQAAKTTPPAPAPAKPATPASPALPAAAAVDPKAVGMLKAMCARLAGARAMTFTAVTSYESPSTWGPALVFATASEVALQRPNRLAVVTAGDGPASEFYYDGKAMMQYSPAENLLAVADAPLTIDAMLKTLYDVAGTYFPFTDVIVADPFADMQPLTLAAYVGQSKVVGGTTTDIVAYESQGVFVQIWIGADDKLPRLARAVYFDDPLQLRQQVELSSWKFDPAVPPSRFATTKAAGAIRIPFANPKTQATTPAAPPKAGKKPAAKPSPAPKP